MRPDVLGAASHITQHRAEDTGGGSNGTAVTDGEEGGHQGRWARSLSVVDARQPARPLPMILSIILQAIKYSIPKAKEATDLSLRTRLSLR